jgi:hypothetical protein
MVCKPTPTAGQILVLVLHHGYLLLNANKMDLLMRKYRDCGQADIATLFQAVYPTSLEMPNVK